MRRQNDDVKHFLDQGVNIDVIIESNCSIKMTALSFAISEGNIATVQMLIDRGADVNWKLKNGFSQLMLATRNRASEKRYSVEIVKLLLDHGADVNFIEEVTGLTPLMTASFFGNLVTAETLIHRGSDVSTRDKDGYSALWYAAYSSKKSLINLLLREGIDVNIRDNAWRTTLMMSAANGNLPIAKHLFKVGCNLNATDSFGWKATDYSSAKNHVDITKYFVSKIAP